MLAYWISGYIVSDMTANDLVTQRVAHELDSRAWSQSELARRVHKTPAWVSKKMSGERRWSVDDLDELARGFELPLERLVGFTLRYGLLKTSLTRRYGRFLDGGLAVAA